MERWLAVSALAILLQLAACGQKGPLFLPTEQPEAAPSGEPEDNKKTS